MFDVVPDVKSKASFAFRSVSLNNSRCSVRGEKAWNTKLFLLLHHTKRQNLQKSIFNEFFSVSVFWHKTNCSQERLESASSFKWLKLKKNWTAKPVEGVSLRKNCYLNQVRLITKRPSETLYLERCWLFDCWLGM